MKGKCNNKIIFTTILTMASAATVSVIALRKALKNKKVKENHENNMLDLIKTTKELKENLDDEKVKKYMEIIDEIELDKASLVIAKDGFDIIESDDNIDCHLKKDLGLLLEMKGVRSCFKY